MSGRLFMTCLLLGAFAGLAIADERQDLLTLPLSPKLAGEGSRPLTGDEAFTFQLSNSPRAHQRPFSFGNRLFNTNWTTAPGSVQSFDGLGPLFNRVSCSGCHTRDGRGQPPSTRQGPMDSMLLRLSLPGKSPHGGPLGLPAYGDQLSERAITGLAPEGIANISYMEQPGHYGDGEAFSLRAPRYTISEPGYGALPAELLISPRTAPQVIGLGLLQAIPESVLAALSDPDDRDGDGISGRVNRVWDKATQSVAAGRFGWKANQPNLLQQNADAAIGDIGLSTSLNAEQNCSESQAACAAAVIGGTPEINDEFLDKLTLYTMTLAVPEQRTPGAAEVKAGEQAFRNLGCSSCHMPSLKTGPVADFPELSNQVIHPFTDLLLHDMGEALADGRPDFEASGTEWRTPPLWGLGLIKTVNGHDFLLHDGRARGFAEAILWHGGEANQAREAFRTAPKSVRDALIAFLNSL